LGWEDWNVALVQPGKEHTGLRSLLMKGLNTSVIPSYDAKVDRIVHEQILKLLVGQTLDPHDIVGGYVFD
jgi:cytochrome P450